MLFTLTSNGQVLFEGKSLGSGGVSATVRDRIRREMALVIIKVEKGAIANLVVRVIDEAKIAGADKISLTSQ
ncbi:MAG TPA: biopolymer transporter ExbD [Opitutaceae bacterium]